MQQLRIHLMSILWLLFLAVAAVVLIHWTVTSFTAVKVLFMTPNLWFQWDYEQWKLSGEYVMKLLFIWYLLKLMINLLLLWRKSLRMIQQLDQVQSQYQLEQEKLRVAVKEEELKAEDPHADLHSAH